MMCMNRVMVTYQFDHLTSRFDHGRESIPSRVTEFCLFSSRELFSTHTHTQSSYLSREEKHSPGYTLPEAFCRNPPPSKPLQPLSDRTMAAIRYQIDLYLHSFSQYSDQYILRGVLGVQGCQWTRSQHLKILILHKRSHDTFYCTDYCRGRQFAAQWVKTLSPQQ